MRLRYETGTATLIQFAAVTILAFINQMTSIITTCVKHDGDCVSNSLVSLILVILVAIWLGFISALGYAAQDKRSKRLAQFLIGAEGFNLLISLFNAKHFPNTLGLITSVIDLALAAWVILLAWRLMRANGGRIVAAGPRPHASSRTRKRPILTEPKDRL
ncbi:MAG: hypothetical protein ABIR37_01070 [Candidatus Saccharimonadales bacterium]